MVVQKKNTKYFRQGTVHDLFVCDHCLRLCQKSNENASGKSQRGTKSAEKQEREEKGDTTREVS